VQLINSVRSDRLVHLIRHNAKLQTVTSKPKKQTNDRMKGKFLLHKDKEEKGKVRPADYDLIIL
jgi:hypothetical protein